MRSTTLLSFWLPAFALSALAFPYAEKGDRISFVERDGNTFTVFDHAETGARLEFVNNSGICETTPGVNQYSGYLSVGTNMNMFFWFFEARNNASAAPLTAWFNGGPGCSSMIGLFQENGPCQFYGGSKTPSLNPSSFNQYSNMIYIDQPIGTGFSYGTDDVSTSDGAAAEVWKLLQAFYAAFPQYVSRDFAIFTESYGGHYGPAFSNYILSQNAAIAKGTVTGKSINLIALGINNGWYDAAIQYKSQIDFAANNTYKTLISASQYKSYLNAYNNQCLPYVNQCTSAKTNSACSSATNACENTVEGPLSVAADFDVYDVRASSDDPNPPSTYVTYLQSSAVQTAIGAKQVYQECPDAPGEKFLPTGDNARTSIPTLTTVINAGVYTLIWAGDADWLCNWYGSQTVANGIQYSGSSAFQSKALAPYTVNGKEVGTFKTQDNLTLMRIYAAGHEVPFYQPAAALQVFIQTLQHAIKPT